MGGYAMTLTAIFAYAAVTYLAVGVIVGGIDMLGMPHRLSSRVAEAPLRLRFLLIPGAAAVWPSIGARTARRSP